MSKEMIISVNGREKKIAIVEDDVVTEFYVERGDENQGIVGNIYKGRVMKVLPGMQSAFVDIGLERDSFLYVSDFFDEEEEEVEVEEKREVPRQAQKQPRSHREGLRIAPPVEQEPEAEKEFELRMAALRHIEELSEEPEIEPAPDDAVLETGVVEAADEAEVDMSPRQRRQRRLRYADREAKAEKGRQPDKVQEQEAAPQADEAEEEYSGRRRRRPRRRRGAETPEAAEAVYASEEFTSGDVEGHSGYIIVHHEPLERITDDDTAVVEGEMLKDALLQERISERIHEEERRTSLLEVEPTPEVLVGSLQRSISTEPGFERVSDDSEARSGAEPGAPEAPDAEDGEDVEPVSEWRFAAYESFAEERREARDEAFADHDFTRPDFTAPDYAPEDRTPVVEIDEGIRMNHGAEPGSELSSESPVETRDENT